MAIETAWVKPPEQVGGLDHLAVQAPCINIYARLLPGITNVTDRARYYSFYPWLIWAFDRAGLTIFDDDFIERFRRADVLFTLIAVRHAVLVGDRYEDHAGATVGSSTLYDVGKNLEHGQGIRISDYSLRKGAKARYFANKFGGLGQYYLGVLRELEILDGDTKQGFRYTRQVGQIIAEQLEEGFDGKLFLSAVDADYVTAEQLDELSSLSPSQLENNPGEQKILGDLFFARGQFFDEEALPRRRTLQSLLQLSDLLDQNDHELSLGTFRACVYSGALPDGSVWLVPDSLSINRKKWQTYARNELLSISVQGMFHVLLDAYEESGLRFDASKQVVDWFLETAEAKEVLEKLNPQQSYADYLKNAFQALPELESWQSENHEVQLTDLTVRLSARNANKSPQNRAAILLASFKTLTALALRRSGAPDPYGDLHFPDRYLAYYPINLRTLDFHLDHTWPALSVREVFDWLLLNWGVDAHLRVGLRKLRGQSKSTFRIRPSDRGMEVIAVPPAVHTSPRFSQAVRILKDLGAFELTDSGRWRPSAFGREMMEIGDAP